MKSFEQVFCGPPAVRARAPGRVNLLGEHTDYNDGFVLPIAIPQQTEVALRPNAGQAFVLHAASLGQTVRFSLALAPEEHFATYVFGCIRLLDQRGVRIPGLDIHVRSDVPIGVGLSSSAALEVATLRALRALLGIELSDEQIALLGQRAEIEFAQVNCGVMDQMASSLADTRHMLFLDTRSLQRRLLPLPAGTEVLVLDSGISRTLAGSGYNVRREECEQAAKLLGVPALRDATDPGQAELLPEPLRRRARHVITENARVLQAAAGVEGAAFGRLMDGSHRSLREDFEVSVPPLDLLVELLQAQDAVHGARLTGAGFGGACVALCQAGTGAGVAEEALGHYRRAGHRGKLLVSGAPTPDSA